MGTYNIDTNFQGLSNLENPQALKLMTVYFPIPVALAGSASVTYNSGIVAEGGMIIQSITVRANASIIAPASATNFSLVASTDAVTPTTTNLGTLTQGTRTFAPDAATVPFVPATNNNYTLRLVPLTPANTITVPVSGVIVFDIQYYNAH